MIDLNIDDRIEDLRKITEIKNILVNYENVKELKIYRLGKFFEEYATKLCDKFICQNKIVKKKYVMDVNLSETLQIAVLYLLKFYVVIQVVYKKMSIGDLSLFINAIDNFHNCIALQLYPLPWLLIVVAPIFSMIRKNRILSSN